MARGSDACQTEPMRRIELGEGAYLELTPHWLEPADADQAFAALQTEVRWEERTIKLFGREVMQPRLVSWVGDPEAAYRYSGVLHEPLPWTPTLAALRACLVSELAVPFNSVLCNLYRNERDSMGMHSDSEPELGPNPQVASLSLGAERAFLLRHRKGPRHGPKLDLVLEHGSLLLMRGTTQHVYKHGVAKLRAPLGPRINLTFRVVQTA
ncbi:MAG: 2OG-Fe(II) oxygenase superfamily protein [Myxococcaceae bacterium]|nr:2OG-Fe(II) oxygenase superfamily protein [Myxococcaceae bacterium]